MSHTVKLHKGIIRHFFEVFNGTNRVDTSRRYFSVSNARRAAKKKAHDIKAKFIEL